MFQNFFERALGSRVTIGDLALFYHAFQRGQTLLGVSLENVGKIYANTLFLGNLFEFLRLKPQLVDPPHPMPAPIVLQEGIRFERVTFHYPGCERVTLQDFNLTVPAGQMVAIVGFNGAGKSTLLKLLCRLYDPQAGRITLDGTDIRTLSLTDLHRLMAVLLQSPVYYHATASQNIALGNLDVGKDITTAEIEAAAREAGADEIIARLPRGYDTLLGKSFANGSELSGGEWQRIALARAFLRQAPIVILDEPTSSMDSWAEAEWLERFCRLVQERTTLIITHRFTTAMRAHVIHVMQGGEIIESGNHDELLALGGLYAKSWVAQMQKSG